MTTTRFSATTSPRQAAAALGAAAALAALATPASAEISAERPDVILAQGVMPSGVTTCPTFNEGRPRLEVFLGGDLVGGQNFDLGAGGDLNLSDCNEFAGVGYAQASPNLSIELTQNGAPSNLVISGSGADGCDTVLAVNTAAGDWMFNDDGPTGTFDPLVRIQNPGDGVYDVWFGTYSDRDCAGVLTLEMMDDVTYRNRFETPTQPPPDNSQFAGGFRFVNNCEHPVQVMLAYRDLFNEWRNEGWYRFEGFTSDTLNSRSGEPLQSTNAIFYYYAETTNEADLVWDGPNTVRFDNRSLGLIRVEDQSDDFEWEINCEEQ